MAKKAPSLSAIRSANAAEARVLDNIHKERTEFVSDLSDTVALALVELDQYNEKIEDEITTKTIADNYGFTYNPFEKTFTKNIDNNFVRVSLDDMVSYNKISRDTDQTFEELFNKPSIIKLHTLTNEDVIDLVSDYVDYKGSYLKSSKRETKERTAFGKQLQSYLPQGTVLKDFEDSLNQSKSISNQDDLLNAINTAYEQEYGNIEEYYADVKSGLIDANMLNSVASFGKHGDKYITMVDGELAHVNEKEMYLKQIYGNDADEMIKASGAGTINKITNLKEYYSPPQSTMGEEGGGSGGGSGSGKLAALGSMLLGGTGLQIGRMAFNAIEGHQADSRRVGQINNELTELSRAIANTQDQKVNATESIIESAGLEVDALTSGAGDTLNALSNTYESSVKAGKGLVTGEQDLILEGAKSQVNDQVVAALDNIENKTNLEVEGTADKFDQQVADMERYKTQLENEKKQLKGKFTYKVAKALS